MTDTKSDQTATAVLEAAVRVFAAEGLAAPISTIARDAGVAHGSVFHHFQSKGNLINAAYLHLKNELDIFVFSDMPDVGQADQLQHMWRKYIAWHVTNPVRRQALARLSASDEITPATLLKSLDLMDQGVEILRRAAASAVLRDVPDEFLFGIVQALSEVTVQAIMSDSARGDELSDVGYHVLRQAIA